MGYVPNWDMCMYHRMRLVSWDFYTKGIRVGYVKSFEGDNTNCRIRIRIVVFLTTMRQIS